ncbi:MAG: O-antigen ligase family protein [Chloroflexi bacterium]|nr:O-antigen ligase family protein [Chloroflexota bacterium]
MTFGLADLPELRHADAPAIGANTFLHREADPAKVERELELLASAGIGLIRQEILWVEIEPHAKGVYIDNHGEDSWAKYDRIVDLAQGFGIEVLARLDRPPPWATPGFNPQENTSIQMPPADFTDFADFAAAVAARYRGKVKYFQIWNEPNLFGEWGGRPPDPAAYLDMLREVGAAVRAANPDAVIVLAGLAPTIETGPDNLSDLLFLERLYQLGARGAFDIASSMSYGLFTGPRDPRIDASRTNLPRAVLWREIMESHGDAGTPIWASEYGWMSLPPGWQGDQGIWGNHPAADQAAWTVDGIRRAREQWPWLPTIMIWAARWPHDTHPDDPTPFFGLLTRDLQPRDHMLALERAYADAPSAGIGLHQETHAAFTFDGPWPRVPSDWASLGFHRQTGQPDARLELRFEGDSVGLLTRRGPDMGQVRVRIDGHSALADALPRNAAGEAILNLYAPEVERLARIPIARGLSQGPHVLELTVMAERDPRSSGGLVIADGALVGNSRPLWPYAAVAATWALALAVLVWAAGGRAVRAAARIPRVELLDRRLPLGLHAGEVAAAALAVVFALLPDGTPASAWTLVRLVLAAALGALALARPRHIAIAAVAAIPFVGVIARTGIYDRPVGETLIVILVIAWVARALAQRRWPLQRSEDADGPEQAASSPSPTPFPLEGEGRREGFMLRLFRRPAPSPLAGEGGGEGFPLPSLPRRRESTVVYRWLASQSGWLWLALAVIAAGVAATLAADFPRVAWRDLRTVIVEPALLFLVLLSVMRDRADAQRLGVALVLGAVVSAVVALALIPAGAVVTDAGPPRLRGLFGSPNNLALILERALPLTVGLALAVAYRRRLRVTAWAAAAVLVAVLVLTFSRGAWIGALAGLAVALIPIWRRQGRGEGEPGPSLSGGSRNPVRVLRRMRTATPLLVAGLMAAGLLAAIVTTGGDNLARLLRPSDAATAARPLLWDSAWRMIADNPVLGVGPDNFLYHYPDYIRPEAWAEPNISHAHNIALDTWLTLGIPGLVVLVGVLAAYARTWRAALRRAGGSRALVYGLGGAMLATLVHGIVDSSLYLPELAATFWVIVAATVILAASPFVIPAKAGIQSGRF